MKIVFATNNVNKLSEIKSLMLNDINILSLEDISCFENLPETENTLKANALQKATYVFENYNLDCFADDTGLEIEALDGRPGVYSARYAGEDCIAKNNIRKVLQELNNETNRKARFVTIIALVLNKQKYFFQGEIHGRISCKEFGNKGFGYDSIFKPDGYDITFAEMTKDQKCKISHRAKAVKALIDFLQHH